MPAPARKTAAKKTPAQAAAAEALNDNDVSMSFRGEQFVITDQIRKSFRFAMAVADRNSLDMIHQMIAPADRERFILLAKPDESFEDVSTEFFEAFAEASGQGNS